MPPKTNFDFDWPELHLCSTNDATCVVTAASTGDWEHINGDDCASALRTNIPWTPGEIDLGGIWPKTQDSTNPYTYTYEHFEPTESNSILFRYKLRHR